MPYVEYPWYNRAAAMIVRENTPYKIAFAECGVAETEAVYTKIFKSKEFQEVLWTERHRYFTEIAQNPSRSKNSAIGLAILALQRLAEEGAWDKVLNGVIQLAKIEGWLGTEQNIQVFANVTAKDIELAKEKLLKDLNGKSISPPPPGTQ